MQKQRFTEVKLSRHPALSIIKVELQKLNGPIPAGVPDIVLAYSSFARCVLVGVPKRDLSMALVEGKPQTEDANNAMLECLGNATLYLSRSLVLASIKKMPVSTVFFIAEIENIQQSGKVIDHQESKVSYNYQGEVSRFFKVEDKKLIATVFRLSLLMRYCL